MDAVERLVEMGGVARRSALGRSVAVARTLADARAAGAVQDLGAGWIATSNASTALVAARRYGATITCASAAPFHGLQLLTPPHPVHLAIPAYRGVGPRRGDLAVVVHRESLWVPPPQTGVPLAPVAHVLTRALRCLPAREAVAMVDSALNQGLVEVEEIARSLAGPGSPRARRTLERCDARSRSANVTSVRLELVGAGFRVEAGAVIDGVGEVDFVVEGRVVVECDGYAYHSGRGEFERDRQRDRALVALGYRVLRFAATEIARAPQDVVTAVLQALSAPPVPAA